MMIFYSNLEKRKLKTFEFIISLQTQKSIPNYIKKGFECIAYIFGVQFTWFMFFVTPLWWYFIKISQRTNWRHLHLIYHYKHHKVSQITLEKVLNALHIYLVLNLADFCFPLLHYGQISTKIEMNETYHLQRNYIIKLYQMM